MENNRINTKTQSNDDFIQTTAASTEYDKLYDDDVLPEKFTKSEGKFRVLFSDVFSHHIFIDPEPPSDPIIDFLRDDSKRFVERDDISSIFINRYVKKFKVSATANKSQIDIDEYMLDDWTDVREIADPPIHLPYKSTRPGSNRLCLLLGEVGQGKSLLLTKVLNDIKAVKLKSELRPVIIYFNLEEKWLKKDGSFKEIDESFWESLFSELCKMSKKAGAPLKIIKQIEEEQILHRDQYETKIAKICKVLPEHGLYAIIAIDNIDRFHFSEMRYSFFRDYQNAQTASIEDNVGQIVQKFSDHHGLGRISAAIVIACRREIYDHIRSSSDGCDLTESYKNNYTKYQVLGLAAKDVLTPRLELFSYIIKELAQKASEADPLFEGKLYQDAYNVFSRAITTRENNTSNSSEDDEIDGDIFELILNLAHQGARGLVQFLTDFQLDCRYSGEAIERIFEKQPRNLLRLFITNRKKRYQQKKFHFPNLFLNDCIIDSNPKYLKAHTEHRQTYWAKWVILNMIDHSIGHSISFGELHRLLVETQAYQDNLFRLAVGSLATPNAFNCITVGYKGDSIESRELSLTKRGRSIIGKTSATPKIPFCFGFDYLQLMIDDPWMKFPQIVVDKIASGRLNLEYTLRKSESYRNGSWEYLQKKTYSVIAFIKVLEYSWEREMIYLQSVPLQYREHLSPNFNVIKEETLRSYKAILNRYGTVGNNLYNNLVGEFEKGPMDSDLEQFWKRI